MPINSSIPLGINPPDLMTPFQAAEGAASIQNQIANSRLNQMHVESGRQDLRNQMFLSGVASEHGSIDQKTGLWSDDAIGKITKENPMLGRDILQKQTKDKMAIEQLSLERGKALVENHKAKSEAINDEQNQAISAADAAPTDQREQVYTKEWMAGRGRLKNSGLFSDDVQFNDMSYSRAKEIAMRRSTKESKNPVQQVEEARDMVNYMKTEYTHLEPNSPQAKQMLQKISDGEAAIKRMNAPTAPMVSMGGKPPSGYRWSKTDPGELEKITGGPADKPKRDVGQADEIARWRAENPFMTQGIPHAGEVSFEQWNESRGKGTQKGDVSARFEADPSMKGMTLGKTTPKGIEVLKDGKIVGHYD